MELSRLDEDGRTTVPLRVRRTLSLAQGDWLDWDLYPEMRSATVSKVIRRG